MTDQEHNPVRLNFQKWKNPDLQPLPLSPEQELVRRLQMQHPAEDPVSQSREDLKSQIRKQLHNGGS
jgi:hypothetical protein